MAPPYHRRLYDSITDIDLEAWNSLRHTERDPFMDPRFLTAIENSMSDTGRFRYIIFFDDNERAVASACMSSYRLDSALLANGIAKKMLQLVGRLVPALTQLNVVFCGLPFSAGQSNMRLAPDVDAGQILPELDDVLCKFARQERARCIVFKEFTAEECERLGPLGALGYQRADSLPMNHTNPEFNNFEHYCSNLKSRRRYPIRRSQKKFAKSDLRVVQMTGQDGADQLLTDDVHALYQAVYD
jgi:predicted N-acyltransferase